MLAKAAQLGGASAACSIGSGVRGIAESAGAFGAATVFVADDERLSAPLPQPRVDVLAKLVRDEGFDTVLFAQSVLAADVAAGLAARLGAGLNWDLVDFDGDDSRQAPALADSVVVDVGWSSDVKLGDLPLGRVRRERDRRHGRGARTLRSSSRTSRLLAEMVEQAHAEQQGPSIEDADVIVAGGRGLGEPEKFALAEELAQALGGAVAATRAVVDAGWYPYSAQVGQTGKTVSPKLYVALGISGAIQHKVGMQGSNVIVAINKDANAPIFEFSDLGVVGDLHADRAEAGRARPRPHVVSVRPAEFPPPWSPSEAIVAPTDPVDERIDVGFLIVGAGPAGLAAAIRLGQLIEEDPETAERLGEVPVAVLEKGKAPGSHLLSGAVVNPRGAAAALQGAQAASTSCRSTARCTASRCCS